MWPECWARASRSAWPGRGEACGLRWSEVDLDAGLLFVVRNRTTAGYQVFEGEPKTAAGVRVVALDRHTVAVLRQHRRRQRAAGERRLAVGKVWHDSGYVFVQKDGSPIHPAYASTRFRLLIARTGVPPVRLHDLRQWRGVAVARGRGGPEGHPGTARPLEHPGHSRHLHQRPAAQAASDGRGDRAAGTRRGQPNPQEDQDQGETEPAPERETNRYSDSRSARQQGKTPGQRSQR
jgi:integrase